MAQKEIGRGDQVFFCRMAAVSTRCIVRGRIQYLIPNFDLIIIPMNQRYQTYFICSLDIKHGHEKSYPLFIMISISKNTEKLFNGISASKNPLKKPPSPGNRYNPRPHFSGPHTTVMQDLPGKLFPRRAVCPGICVS